MIALLSPRWQGGRGGSGLGTMTLKTCFIRTSYDVMHGAVRATGVEGAAGPGLPGDFKGNYELFAVVTHKGREADGGTGAVTEAVTVAITVAFIFRHVLLRSCLCVVASLDREGHNDFLATKPNPKSFGS